MILKVKSSFFCKLLLLICLSAIYLNASHLRWMSSYEDARKKAQIQHKNILVLLIQKDSAQINVIIKESFMNQEYIKRLEDEFIAVIVRSEGYNSYPIELLYTQLYPTLFFLSQDELFLLDPLEGVITPSKIIKKLSELD